MGAPLTTKQKHGLIVGASVAAAVVAVTGAVLAMYFLGVFRKKSGAAPVRRPGFTCVPREQKCVFAADNDADPAVHVYATAEECKCWQCDDANACRFVSSNTEEGNASAPLPPPRQRQRPGYTCAPASQTCEYNDDNGSDPAINVYSAEKECKCWTCSNDGVDACRFVQSNTEAGDFSRKEDCNCKYSCVA